MKKVVIGVLSIGLAFGTGSALAADRSVAEILKEVNGRLEKEFIGQDGLMLDYVGPVPTPWEIAELKPNAMGWWTPIENGTMFTGEWLPALMQQGIPARPTVIKCVKGLLKMSEVSDVPGVIARGTGTDGKSHYPCGSNDQTDPWFFGLCEFCRWPHAFPDLKAEVRKRLVEVAMALEKNDWGVPCDGAFKGENRGNLNSKAMPFWGKTRLLYTLKSLERLTYDDRWGKRYDEVKASALDGIEAGGEVDEKAFPACYTHGLWIYVASAEALARLIQMEGNPADRARMKAGFLKFAERCAPLMKDRARYANTTERPFKYANWREGYDWRPQKTQKEAEAVAGAAKGEVLGTRKDYERRGMANPLAAAAICALQGDPKFRDEILATLRHYDYSTPNVSEFFHAAIAAAALERVVPELSVDFDREVGTVRRELHASGFGPQICSCPQQYIDDIRSMGFSYSRTHDWALINSNQRVCDYFHIFPLMHADPADPKNYVFGPTDYLLKRTREEVGHDIFYRLGTSIEHSGDKVHFNSAIPEDFDKLAEIFAGTVRHYNRGWAKGFYWNIRYWEIWNEPDGVNNMWCLPEGDVPADGNKEEQERRNVKRRDLFVKFFVTCLKRLKSEFPDVKVGGPALCCYKEDYFRALLEACKAAGVAPDFISWHGYEEDPARYAAGAVCGRALCDSYGFTKCELIINEWHYFSNCDYTWGELRSPDPAVIRKVWAGPRSHNGIDSSCFNLAALSLFQTSKFDQCYYYGCRNMGAWGYMNEQKQKYKVYYGLKLFGDFVKGYDRLCAAEGYDPESHPVLTVLAAKSSDGRRRAVLVSDYRVETDEIVVDVKGVPAGAKVSAKVHDYMHDLVSADVTFADGKLTLKKSDCESAAFLVEFE